MTEARIRLAAYDPEVGRECPVCGRLLQAGETVVLAQVARETGVRTHQSTLPGVCPQSLKTTVPVHEDCRAQLEAEPIYTRGR